MKSAAILSFASLAAAWCGHGTTLQARAEGEFNYHELTGALNWHSLSPNNSVCASGTNQSPIDVKAGTRPSAHGDSLSFNVDRAPSGAEIENLGHGVQATATGSIKLRDTKYELRQFHFHTPSEHHIGSEFYPAEVHFVFQAPGGSLSVVGIMLEIAGSDDERISPLISDVLGGVDKIPNAGDKRTSSPLDFFDVVSHVSTNQLYQYSGSLTTPPCAEQVAWNLVDKPLFIEAATFRKAKAVMKFNSRYTQNTPGQVNLLTNARNTVAA